MPFFKERDRSIETIFPINDLDAINGEEIKKYAVSILDKCDAVIVNFSRVNYLNSSGLRELIQMLKSVQESGKKMCLTALSDNIKKIFVNTNLTKIFKIYESDEDAKRDL